MVGKQKLDFVKETLFLSLNQTSQNLKQFDHLINHNKTFTKERTRRLFSFTNKHNQSDQYIQLNAVVQLTLEQDRRGEDDFHHRVCHLKERHSINLKVVANWQERSIYLNQETL